MTTVPIFRRYYDCRYGQLHVLCARPVGGGDPERPPLICLHQTPKSAAQMTAVIERMGSDRLVYAPDFPGFGQSDKPVTAPSIEDYAAAIGDLLDEIGHPQVDIYGYHTGAMNAIELAERRPQKIRRLVLIGVPLLNEEEQQAIRETPWPVPIEENGSHLLTEWHRSVEWAGPGQTLDMISAGFADKLIAGPNAHWGALAAAAYDLKTKLAAIRQPVLVIGPRDDNWQTTPRARGLLRNGRVELWRDFGFGVMDVASDLVAETLRGHLDGSLADYGDAASPP